MRDCGMWWSIPMLPGRYGIGNIGIETAHDLGRYAHETGQNSIYLLPTNELGRENFCPYLQANDEFWHLLLDPEWFITNGLIARSEVDQIYRDCYNGTVVNYALAERNITKVLEIASERYVMSDKQSVDNMAVVFMACRDKFGPEISEWPEEVRRKKSNAISMISTSKEAKLWRVAFDSGRRQFKTFRETLNNQGVAVYGDQPFYHGLNSMAVWLNPECFEVDPVSFRMLVESGVAPDYFNPKGQRWGSPVYSENPGVLSLWAKEIRHASERYDGLRIDHAQGIWFPYQYPAKGESGYFKGFGDELMHAILSNAGTMKLYAEDLGDMAEQTKEHLARFGIPSMRVAALSNMDEANVHWPSNWPVKCKGFVGSHDCDAVRHLFAMRGVTCYEDATWNLIEQCICSQAESVILSPVDLFNMQRYNTPGTTYKRNWTPRITEAQFNDPEVRKRIREFNAKGKRC